MTRPNSVKYFKSIPEVIRPIVILVGIDRYPAIEVVVCLVRRGTDHSTKDRFILNPLNIACRLFYPIYGERV